MTKTKIHIKILLEISYIRQKFYKKFLIWLNFKFFKTIIIFLNHFVNRGYFLKIPLIKL